jgi:hypothetical protein
METDDPMLTNSRVDNEHREPMFIKPETEAAEPIREKLLRDSALPTLT